MIFSGNLLKMKSEYGNPVQYFLELNSGEIHMNHFLGKTLRLEYQSKINCIKCGKPTKTSFAQGYCYPCFISAPETEDCVLRPELCKAHLGESRNMEFAKDHCLIDHVVYLAASPGLKVGVTRHNQVPTRWIDQGAWNAIKLAITPNRFLAGCIEVALKEFMNDKTNWRDMLTGKREVKIDLIIEKQKAIENLHPDFREFSTPDNLITNLEYPVLEYPKKVKSISLDKVPFIEDILTGIKGQYLMFQSGAVINIRKHNGYLVTLTSLS